MLQNVPIFKCPIIVNLERFVRCQAQGKSVYGVREVDQD
jgi:hypothetical protein